jgi:hypothetical protein
MKNFKSYAWMAIGCALVIAVFSGMTAGPALAQLVKAALVKNVDERGRVPYEEEVVCSDFTFFSDCTVEAAAVPPAKRLVIEHVSMDLLLVAAQSGPTPRPRSVTMSGNEFTIVGQQFFRQQFLAPSLLSADSTLGPVFAHYAANQAVLTYYESGQKPKLSVSSDAVLNTNLSIVRATFSGYFVDLSL